MGSDREFLRSEFARGSSALRTPSHARISGVLYMSIASAPVRWGTCALLLFRSVETRTVEIDGASLDELRRQLELDAQSPRRVRVAVCPVRMTAGTTKEAATGRSRDATA